MFPHFIQSMLLAYIDSIEPMVASAHAQMQMKQANLFFAIFFGLNICRPVLFCYRCCYAPDFVTIGLYRIFFYQSKDDESIIFYCHIFLITSK